MSCGPVWPTPRPTWRSTGPAGDPGTRRIAGFVGFGGPGELVFVDLVTREVGAEFELLCRSKREYVTKQCFCKWALCHVRGILCHDTSLVRREPEIGRAHV